MPHFVRVTVFVQSVGPRAHLRQRFECGPQTSFVYICLSYRVFQSFCVSYLSRANFHFTFNCCLDVVSYRKFVRVNRHVMINVHLVCIHYYYFYFICFFFCVTSLSVQDHQCQSWVWAFSFLFLFFTFLHPCLLLGLGPILS